MDIYNIYEKKILEVLKSKTAKHEEEMMKSNFVQLSWNDTSKKILEAGTYIVPFADGVKYRLLDDYEPKQKTEASFEYAPEFQHPIMMLGKIPFILTTGDTTSFQTADKETDWVYTGVASTIIQKIVDYINIIGAEIPDIGTGWFAVIDADIIGSKTCTFSAMDVLSAISECCNQWSCEYYLHYETKALYFGKVGIGDAVTLKVGENIGIPSVSESKEGYYNAFLVKGSTRNISQRSASGENTSVNKRLTLDPVKYPYGYIDKRENTAEPLMVKELIFEEVYPKLDLYVYNPRCRTRYLKDDDGNTVPGIDGKPKKYAVWYIRLAYLQNGVWMDYKITDDVVLSNKYQADNVGYYYNRYGNADHLTYKYAVFTNADFDAKWFTNKVTCQTSYSQYYVTVKAGDIVETAIAINNNGTLVLLIGESYTNYNNARNDSRGKAFRLAAQKYGIILQKYITEANIPSDYRHSQILDGMELSMSFQANENENALPSPLAGQEFKLRYHKDAKTIRANTEDGDSGMSVLAGDFEIVFEEGDIIIPTTIDGELYPRGERTPSLTGNKAILFNIAMDERYKAQAYLDLETTANKEIERLCSDLNNYTFPSNPVVFEKELTNPHLHVGMKVKYDDGQGYTLDTRVLKLVTQLDFEFKQSITVGNEQIKGTISELREQIQQISTGGGGTGSGGGVNISDLKNLLMYYGRNYFLSKQNDDATPYNLSIGKTLNVGENINVSKDLNVGGNTKVDGDVDIDGFLKVLAAYISKIQSSNYTGDGLNDTGFKITNDKDGHSYLVVDELLVRMKAVFNELEVRKMTYSGGNVVYSGAGSKIFRVEYLKKASPDAEDGEVLGYTVVKVPWLLYGSPLAIENYVLGSRKKVRTEVNMAEVTHFRCYLIADDGTMATTNWWERYDQARCQTFNLSKNGRNAANGTDSVNTYGINESNLQNNFYWRLVSHVGQQRLEDDKVYNYVDLSKTDCLAGSGIPVAGDSIVQFGNRSKVERQNVITLEVIGEDAPAIKEYMGINSYDLTNKRRTMISPKSGDEFYATRFVIVTSYGAQYPIPVDRGLWLNIPLDVKGHRRCYYYDRLSHNGSTWLCMVADGWHYEDANGNVVSSDTEGAIRTRNYTTDEPSLTSQDWQISVEKGERGYATFKSLVFKRAASKPAKPAANEGSFQSPVPSGWSDGIPAGNDTIWMTSRIFTSDGGGIQESAWTNVELMSDTETFDVEFAKLQPNRAKPAEPNYATNAIKGDTSANKVWYDPSEIDDVNVKSEDMVWMATRTKDNGVWGSWTIAKIKGEDGGFKSSVFARTNTRPATPAGGTYTSPYPTTPANVWHDGIPNGEAQIWMSVCTFWPDGSSSGWSTPQPQSDTDTLDIEFSPSATEPSAPTGNTPFANHETEGWYDPSSANFATAGQMIWRGERKVSNGEFNGDWVITRIYGEKGDQGIRGDFKSRVFLRQNTNPATPSGGTYDSPIPKGWYDGIPSGDAIIWSSVCTFYGAGGSSGWSIPAPESDTDTLDIEFSPSATEPSAPTGNTPFANHETEGWYDPSSANFATAGQMIWRGERKVSNGVYNGSWVITRIYGEKGNPGNNAKGTKMRFTAAMTASATAPTLATVNKFTWYDTAASPTESYPCVYCSIWEINYDGSLVQCLSVSLFNRYGKTGNNGSDAYSFQLSSQSVIIGQATTSPYSMLIDGTPTGNTATTIIVRKGNKACTVNISSLTTHHCNASRTYGGTTYSNIFWITAVLTDSNSNYYETGYVEVTFTVTDPDNANNTFSTTLRFNFYCNLMGTWKTTIEGDVERSVATKIEYLYSDDNPNKVVKNADYVRSSSEMSSTIKSTLERLGANLLPLNKWIASSRGTDPDYIQDYNLLISNQVWLNHGVTYCFSFYAPKNSYTDNNYIDIIGMQDRISNPNNYLDYQYMWEEMSEVTVDTSRHLMGNYQMLLHYFTFSPYHEDKYIILRFYDYYKLYQPKLEIGTVPSDYDTENMKMTSESVVRQLADKIYLGIVNALGETGIYIDGANRHIDLTAAIVNISESLVAKTLLTERDNAQVSIQEGFMEFKSKLNQTKILFGIDDEGNAVLNYYGSNGNFLYGLGPNKIFETKSQAESMTLTYYDVDAGSNYASSVLDSVVVQLYLYIFKNETPSSLTSLYKYLAKITAGQYGPGIYCASSADAASYNEKIIKNGYSSTTKLQSSDIYYGGIVVTSGRTIGGIIKYLSSIRNDLSNIEYEGWYLMQDSDFNRTLTDGCYYFNTKDEYSPVQAFYWDRYNGGAIGYGDLYYNQWQNLNVCTNPDDDDTLIDPIYYFALTEVNANGGIEGVRYLYINKSKLSRILQQYNKIL